MLLLSHCLCLVSKVSLYDSPQLLTDIIHPGILETRCQLADDLSEMREQIRKQLRRLCELRAKKAEEPGSFYFDIQSIRLTNPRI